MHLALVYRGTAANSEQSISGKRPPFLSKESAGVHGAIRYRAGLSRVTVTDALAAWLRPSVACRLADVAHVTRGAIFRATCQEADVARGRHSAPRVEAPSVHLVPSSHVAGFHPEDGSCSARLQRAQRHGSYLTAWLLLKLRTAMVRPGIERLDGLVEIDEANIGGEEDGVRVASWTASAWSWLPWNSMATAWGGFASVISGRLGRALRGTRP